MARFSSLIRKQPKLPPVSIKDTYLHPTVRSLAAAIGTAPAAAPFAPAAAPAAAPYRATTPEYVLCALLQALTFLVGMFAAGFVLVAGFRYTLAATTPLELLLRSVLVSVLTFAGTCVLPVAAKWLLIGRWTVREIPVWTLAYYRFWLVKTLVHASPARLFVGSPLFALYLRALGARIGRGTMILASDIPACTDLLTIGAGTVIRKEASLHCYRVVDGVIQTGTVTIGHDAFLGEGTVIDIGASVGNNAQLGHASALYAGQRVPDGESWHGAPAEPTDADYRGVAPVPCSTLRRVIYSLGILINRVGIALPLGIFGLSAILPALMGEIDLASPLFYGRLLLVAFAVFATFTLSSLAMILTVPRLLYRMITAGKVYPLYGFHYSVFRTISRMTNMKFFMTLTGDSSLILHYLRILGYKMPNPVQTGSNFGVSLKHEIPYLCTVGSGTMVADGLTMMNAEFSNSSFTLPPVTIGAENFLGNGIAFPPSAQTGDNVLLATKAMVPVTGSLREGVGLLGSPSFEIPRSVQRDTAFDSFKSGDAFREGLKGKNRHNAVTILFFLLMREGMTFATLVITAVALDFTLAVDAARGLGQNSVSGLDIVISCAAVLAITVFSVAYFTIIEWATVGFKRMQPVFCSIYQRPFWRHERFWKLSGGAMLGLFNGTPFKSIIWRMLGTRVGRRLFDDGCGIPEKSIVTIGDDCTLNAQSLIQCHSMEDGAFKLEETVLGSHVTLSVGAFVHYGVRLGDGAFVEADSFLMKGEDVPAGARFGGNPAEALSAPSATITDRWASMLEAGAAGNLRLLPSVKGRGGHAPKKEAAFLKVEPG